MNSETKKWWVESPLAWVFTFALVAIVFFAFNHSEWILANSEGILSAVGVFLVAVVIYYYKAKKKELTAEEVVGKYRGEMEQEKMEAGQICHKYENEIEADDDEDDIENLKQSIFSKVVIIILSVSILILLGLIIFSSMKIDKLEKQQEKVQPLNQGKVQQQEKPLVPVGAAKAQKEFVKKGLKL